MGSAYHSMQIWKHSTKILDPDSKSKEKSRHQLLHDYNPLLNLLIFNKILDNLNNLSTVSALLPLRLVCSSWNAEVCRRLESQRHLPITYLKFQQDSDLQELNKILSKPHPPVNFFLTNFYFKLPRFTPLLGQTLSSPWLQEVTITTLKVAISGESFPILLLHLKSLKGLKHLFLIRLPDKPQLQTHPFWTGSGNNAQLEHLESLKLRNLTCAKSSFAFDSIMSTNHTSSCCTADLVSFLNCVPNLQVLDMAYWPGKIIPILERCKRFHGTLKVLRIKGKSLGDDDVKRLTRLGFQSLSRIDLVLDRNVTEDVIHDFISALNTRRQNKELLKLDFK